MGLVQGRTCRKQDLADAFCSGAAECIALHVLRSSFADRRSARQSKQVPIGNQHCSSQGGYDRSKSDLVIQPASSQLESLSVLLRFPPTVIEQVITVLFHCFPLANPDKTRMASTRKPQQKLNGLCYP